MGLLAPVGDGQAVSAWWRWRGKEAGEREEEEEAVEVVVVYLAEAKKR